MSFLDKIFLNFEVNLKGDPKILSISDVSVWGNIKNKPALLEITVPGSERPKIYSVSKNKNNVFNSSNLFISNLFEYTDLPDGFYKITMKGSPDDFCVTKWHLKDDSLKEKMAKTFFKNFCDDDAIDKLDEIRKYIENAQMALSINKKDISQRLFKKALNLYDKIKHCEKC